MESILNIYQNICIYVLYNVKCNSIFSALSLCREINKQSVCHFAREFSSEFFFVCGERDWVEGSNCNMARVKIYDIHIRIYIRIYIPMFLFVVYVYNILYIYSLGLKIDPSCKSQTGCSVLCLLFRFLWLRLITC